MKLEGCNPYIRCASVQPSVLEGTGLRKAYDYRLFYILQGKGSIRIDETICPLAPDALILIPPGMPYDFQGQMRTLVLNFDLTRHFAHRTEPICPPPAAGFEPEWMFETETLDEFPKPYVCQADVTVREMLLEIIRDVKAAGDYADASSSARLKLVLAQLLRRNVSPEVRLCERALSHIRMHAAQVRCNSDVASALGYHPVYLGEVLRRVTGKSLHETIVEEKIRLSCRWLYSTDVPISDLWELAGFSSRQYFSTVFKSRMGLSPLQYRKQARTQRRNLAASDPESPVSSIQEKE